MNAKLIITLLNLPRVSRKTINSLIKIKVASRISIDEIKDMFIQGKLVNSRLSIPTDQAINEAIIKADEIIYESDKNGINYITILDDDFPNRLKYINDPPVIIYYKGNKKCILDDKSIAIIGTRTPTSHGEKISERLGYLFGKDNFVVVSGLAKGCDEFAHKGCVNIGGRSIAVLPCGLDTIYPARNKELAKLIIANNGCIVSEYPVGVKAFKSYFIDRDRIQSALSQAILVIESAEKSGTMHTVGFCIAQNKILACYKNIEKYSNNISTLGNIKLINDGRALAISSADDIHNLKNQIINKLKCNNDNDISASILPIQTTLF